MSVDRVDYFLNFVNDTYKLYKYTLVTTSTGKWIPINVSSTKTFTIKLNNINVKPYENLWVKALPTLSQRITFNNIIRIINNNRLVN